ncbi:MAG TPA: YkgJ family cysteine cluster protein [Verrucomicrobiae bacterium]|jgi:hypothetical protein
MNDAVTGQLCLACGLCCDGTLFHDVKLHTSDDATKLKAFGLPIRTPNAKLPISKFPQPCAALCADRTCRAYADRPLQCHVFECGVFKGLTAGRIEFPTALRLVTQARQRADKVRRLLRDLGDTAEGVSLSERFRRVQRRMESSPLDEETAECYADLTLAVHELNVLTHEKFYTKADEEPITP